MRKTCLAITGLWTERNSKIARQSLRAPEIKNFRVPCRGLTDRVVPRRTLAARLRQVSTVGVSLLFFTFWQACSRSPARNNNQNAIPPARSTEQLVIDYLGKIYEQPRNNEWEEGKVYFMPAEPGLVLLPGIRRDADLKGLLVYKASVWFIHWGPEESAVLVWVVTTQGPPRLGVLNGPDEIATRFPRALQGLTFDRPEARKQLALLVGEMATIFYPRQSAGDLQVLSSERKCEWVGWRDPSQVANRPVAASCFSNRGIFGQVIIPNRE